MVSLGKQDFHQYCEEGIRSARQAEQRVEKACCSQLRGHRAGKIEVKP